MEQRLAEDDRLSVRARADLDPGIPRRHDDDGHRALDQHGLSSRWQRVSTAGPGDDDLFEEWRWLAVRAFAHVAQSRRAAGEPRQSAGEGLVDAQQVRRAD